MAQAMIIFDPSFFFTQYSKVLLGFLEGNMEVLEVPIGSGLTPTHLL